MARGRGKGGCPFGRPRGRSLLRRATRPQAVLNGACIGSVVNPAAAEDDDAFGLWYLQEVAPAPAAQLSLQLGRARPDGLRELLPLLRRYVPDTVWVTEVALALGNAPRLLRRWLTGSLLATAASALPLAASSSRQ